MDRLQIALDYVVSNTPLMSVQSQLKKLGTMAIGTGVAMTGAFVAFGKASISAASESIEAGTKLSAVLKNVKGVTDEQVQSIKDYAGELQKLGVVDGDVAISGMQQLGTFQLQADTLKKLMPGMNDLLAQQKGVNATSGDAVNIGNLLGKVMNGQVGALSRVGISFNAAQEKILKFGTESEKASVLSQVLKDNVGGVNAALLQTDAGKIAQAKIQFGDMQETIGAILLPILGQFAQWFTTKIPMIQDFLVGLYGKFQELQKPIADLMDKLKEFGAIIVENKDVIAVLAVGLGAYYVASAAVLAINTAIGTYQKIMTAYTLAQSTATGGLTFAQWALNTAMSANPIGLIVGGLTLLVAGIVLAYNKSETFRGFIDALWLKFKEFGSYIMGIPAKLKEMWASINENPFAKLALDILALASPITAIIRHFDKLKEAWNWVKGKINGGEVNVNSNTTKKIGMPSHRTGESFVPNDTVAQLHYGERVLTKSENESYTKGSMGSGGAINFTINATADLANEIRVAIEPVVNKIIKSNQQKTLMKMGIGGA